MTIGNYKIGLEKRITLSGWQAAWISFLAIIVALMILDVVLAPLYKAVG